MTRIAFSYIFLSVKFTSLAEYLDKTGMTQVALAAKLQISQAHLSLILSGQRSPSIELAALIEDETGVPMRSFVSSETRA